MSILEREHTSQQATKPGQDKIFSARVEEEKGRKLLFSSGPEESEILRGKVGPRTCKGRELWSQNVADMHLRREKSISGGDR